MSLPTPFSAILRNLVLAVALVPASIHFSIAPASAAPAVSDFYRDAEFETVALSPGGDYLAADVPLEDRSALTIIRLSDMKTTGVFKPEKGAYIDDFLWVSDKRILFTMAMKQGRLESPESLPGMLAMDFDGGKVVKFFDQNVILSDLTDNETQVLVQYYDPVLEDTYGLKDIYTGGLTPSKQVSPAKDSKFEGIRYFADASGRVPVFVAGRAGTDEKIYYTRPSETAPWAIAYDEGVSKEALRLLGFSPDRTQAYFSKQNQVGGPDSVVSIDLASRAMTVVARDDNVDPYVTLKSPADGSVFAIKYLDGKPRYEYLYPGNPFAVEHNKLRNSFPGQDVIPAGYSKGGSKAIYYVWSDRNPGDYYLYDRDAGKAAYLMSDMGWLDPADMADTQAVHFSARDGTAIEAFLTLPKNGKSGLPLVINPHGGPFGKYDRWGFDPEVQMMAARGYAVLQVNFRGSGNYGKRFEEAGYKQWGKAMQDDLTDATRWAIGQGIADPDRICIYGASYGAYAAMMGVAREPALYACAIGYVGVYDLKKVIRDDSKGAGRKYSEGWWAKNYFEDTMGDEDLAATSPVNLAAGIKVPVLLAGGELDETAPIKQTKLMQAALAGSGNQPEMKIYYNEGHGNFLMQNRLDWANRVLDFLDRNIGPKSGR